MIRATPILVTPPAFEPLTLEDAKRHARIDGDDGNRTLIGFIAAAREAAEDYLGRGLITQTWRFELDAWASTIELPMAAPLQSVTGITYVDVNGATQTLSSAVYTVDTSSWPGRVLLTNTQTWPTLGPGLQAKVKITYIVGYTTRDLIPEAIKQGLRAYVAALDADRDGLAGGDLAMQAARLCWRDRVFCIGPGA